jgi:hypothetical protein
MFGNNQAPVEQKATFSSQGSTGNQPLTENCKWFFVFTPERCQVLSSQLLFCFIYFFLPRESSLYLKLELKGSGKSLQSEQ